MPFIKTSTPELNSFYCKADIREQKGITAYMFKEYDIQTTAGIFTKKIENIAQDRLKTEIYIRLFKQILRKI